MKKIPVTDEAETVADAAEASPARTVPGKPTASSTEDHDSEDPMTSMQADIDRFRDLALRTQADFENYKKRCAREKDDAIKYANTSLLDKLVPIIDNFELGLAAAKTEGEKSPIFSGMNLVLKQLQDFLIDNGLQPIDAVGQIFDPNLHEAIAHEPSDEGPDHVVIRQTRRGYKFRDRLLRPSSVVVSSGPAK